MLFRNLLSRAPVNRLVVQGGSDGRRCNAIGIRQRGKLAAGCHQLAVERDRQVHDRTTIERGNQLVIGEDLCDVLDGVGDKASPLSMHDIEPAIAVDRLGTGNRILHWMIAISPLSDPARYIDRQDGEEPVANQGSRQVVECLPERSRHLALEKTALENFASIDDITVAHRQQLLTVNHLRAQAKPPYASQPRATDGTEEDEGSFPQISRPERVFATVDGAPGQCASEPKQERDELPRRSALLCSKASCRARGIRRRTAATAVL